LIADWKLLGFVTVVSGVLLMSVASLAAWSDHALLATRPAIALLLVGGILTAVNGVGIARRKPAASLLQSAISLMWSGHCLFAADSWSSASAAALWLIVPAAYWANYLSDCEPTAS
jgi:hypothetical protein